MALTIQDIIAQPPTEAAHIVAVAAEASVAAAVAVAAARDEFGIMTSELRPTESKQISYYPPI